jgi:hypothetical protein
MLVVAHHKAIIDYICQMAHVLERLRCGRTGTIQLFLLCSGETIRCTF